MRKNRKLAGTIICLVAAGMVTTGIFARTSFAGDYVKMKDVGEFSVAEWSDTICNGVEEQMLERLPEADVILRVKASGKSQISRQFVRQKVTVVQIFKGDSLKKGDKIRVMWESSMAVLPEKYLNMGFVNFMKEDHEYLIFLNEREESAGIMDADVWTLALPELFIAPVFDYDTDVSNVRIPITDLESRYVSYEQVKENEFFVEDEASLERLLELKDTLLLMYPKK